jgi:serine protease Do
MTPLRRLGLTMRNISVIAFSLIATGIMLVPPGFGQRTRASRAVVVTRSGSYLGIGGIDIDEERAKALNLKEARGVEIKSVDTDSPASKAGLKEGDVVLDYHGTPVMGFEQFARLVRETPSGRQVRIAVWRAGATQTVTATIATRPGYVRTDGDGYAIAIPTIPPVPPIPDLPQAHMTWPSSTLGVVTESLSSQLAEFFGVKEGALVRSVTRNSAADKAGIKAGDVIVKVDDAKVSSPREITNAMRALHTKRTFSVVVVRNRQETTLSVTLEERRGMREERSAETRHC